MFERHHEHLVDAAKAAPGVSGAVATFAFDVHYLVAVLTAVYMALLITDKLAPGLLARGRAAVLGAVRRLTRRLLRRAAP